MVLSVCPQCGHEVMTGYTKKALKKILKNMGSDKILDLKTVINSNGHVLYMLPQEN